MAGRRPTGTWKCRGRQDAGSDRRPVLHTHGAEEIRQRISREAARIMAEEGVRDFHTAKRKATERLNLPEARHLPSNQEIEQALAGPGTLCPGQRLRIRVALDGTNLAAHDPLERWPDAGS